MEEYLNDQQSQNPGTAGLIITALQSHFKAKKDQAVAQLSMYVNYPAGVADHPNLIDECVALVKQISDAEDNMRVVQSLFVRKD